MHCIQHNGDISREFYTFTFFIEKTNSSETTTFLESVYRVQSSNYTPYQSVNHWLLYNKPAVWGTVLPCFCSRTVTDDDCRDKLPSNERERVGHTLSPIKGTLHCLFLCAVRSYMWVNAPLHRRTCVDPGDLRCHSVQRHGVLCCQGWLAAGWIQFTLLSPRSCSLILLFLRSLFFLSFARLSSPAC